MRSLPLGALSASYPSPIGGIWVVCAGCAHWRYIRYCYRRSGLTVGDEATLYAQRVRRQSYVGDIAELGFRSTLLFIPAHNGAPLLAYMYSNGQSVQSQCSLVVVFTSLNGSQ